MHTEGPTLVIAGAGSGKTRALTMRIAHLLEKGVPPWAILALTFTNKAAREMQERIAQVVGGEKSRQLWMGTFHSRFGRILRKEAEALGYTRNFIIYDTIDSKSLVKKIVKDLKLDDKTYKPNEVLGRISKAKNNLITAGVYAQMPEHIEHDRKTKKPEFAQVFRAYEQRLRRSDAMDFDDLLLNTNILFRDHPGILDKYRKKFQYVLVDEYQDTNYSQYLIIKKLSEERKNICVVGDDSQSIYSFRGARIENILNFRNDYPGLKLIKLERNYRSTQNIVNAANGIIEHNSNRIPKKVFSKEAAGEKIKLLRGSSDAEEAYLVCNALTDSQYRNRLKPSGFAILYRTNAQSRNFEVALRKRGIPYRIYGGLSFYQRKEIKDVLAYFRLVINPQDEEALRRVINYPARGIGATTIGKMDEYALAHSMNLWQILSDVEQLPLGMNKGTVSKLATFRELIKGFRAQQEEKDAYDLGHHIASESGVLKDLYQDRSAEGISRHENLEELLNSMKEAVDNYREEEGSTLHLAGFMEEVALQTDQDTGKDDTDKVTLMTVHSAKGLEFAHVFVVGLEEELFPSAMSSATQQELEEERRLFYVAITRAKQEATLCFAQTRMKWGEFNFNHPSRFLRELDVNYLDMSEDIRQELFPESEAIETGRRVSAKKTMPATPPSDRPGRMGKLSSRDAVRAGNRADFQPDDPGKIQQGMRVEHKRFGKGTVLELEGSMPNTKAKVEFDNSGTRQLLLKFAQLRIVPQK